MNKRAKELMKRLDGRRKDVDLGEGEWDSYEEYLNSDTWKEKRGKAVQAVGGKCQLCGDTPDSVDVHHHTYPGAWGKEGVDDLTVLCRRCHERHHGKSNDVHITEERLAQINESALRISECLDRQSNGVAIVVGMWTLEENNGTISLDELVPILRDQYAILEKLGGQAQSISNVIEDHISENDNE